MRPSDAVGLPLVDRLATLDTPTLEDYVAGASEYVRLCRNLTPGQGKAAQIRLSGALGKAFRDDLRRIEPRIQGLIVGERNVEGELRTAKADVSQIDPVHGVRLAVEIKPVNLAVGRGTDSATFGHFQ